MTPWPRALFIHTYIRTSPALDVLHVDDVVLKMFRYTLGNLQFVRFVQSGFKLTIYTVGCLVQLAALIPNIVQVLVFSCIICGVYPGRTVGRTCACTWTPSPSLAKVRTFYLHLKHAALLHDALASA